MLLDHYIYTFTYDTNEKALCKLESKCLFKKEEKLKALHSGIRIEPSSSAFIKSRIEVVLFSNEYEPLIEAIKSENIIVDGFKVEYLVFEGDETSYDKRLEKLKDVGYSIEGEPDYYKPTITYALCCYQQTWCFGVLVKDKFDWRKHNKKPSSYSNSININIAKSLVNIASCGNKARSLLDACCGVGTILLEACFAEYKIEGCDINWKICKGARKNLAHFNYETVVYRSDIKDIDKQYDAAIIDLPYNLLSVATDDDVLHIIKSTTKIANRLVIVSVTDISNFIDEVGFFIKDDCRVSKKGKSRFERRIWVCEKV